MTKMKAWSSCLKVVKFICVTGLACGLLFLTIFRSSKKRSPQSEAGFSQVATNRTSTVSATKADPKWIEAYGKLPLRFEENQGQTNSEVRYVSHGSGYELFLTPQDAVLALRSLAPQAKSARNPIVALRESRNARFAE